VGLVGSVGETPPSKAIALREHVHVACTHSNCWEGMAAHEPWCIQWTSLTCSLSIPRMEVSDGLVLMWCHDA
jgi:hypothetical protein